MDEVSEESQKLFSQTNVILKTEQTNNNFVDQTVY